MFSHNIPFLFIIFSIWITGSDTVAQNSNPVNYGNQFNAKQWMDPDGLPNNVQAMVQDYAGYLWIGNEYGLSRLDGFTSTLFNRHTVKALTEDDCGALCIIHDSSLVCGMYNGLLTKYKDGRFEIMGNKTDFNSKTITSIVEDADGKLWIATDGAGLFRYDNKTFTAFGVKEGIGSLVINSLARGSHNEIWAGTKEGLYLVQDGNITRYGIEQGLPFTAVSSLLVDRSGKLWIGGSNGDIAIREHGSFSRVKGLASFEGSPVTALHESLDGKIWILTRDFGVNVFDTATSTLFLIKADPKLTEFSGTAIITDREGDIIIGTQGASIFRLRKNLLRTYTTSDGLPDNTVMGLFRDRNNDVWIGSVSGKIGCYRQGKFFDLTSGFGIKDAPIFSISGGKDDWIWAATYGELVGWDGKNRKSYPAGKALPNTLFHAIYTARDGALWAGTDVGVMVIKEGEIKTITSKDGLTDQKIFCFYEDPEGDMWIGTQEGGINIIKKGKIGSITRMEGISDNLILCFHRDQSGAMWVGTGHDGLNRIDGKTGKISQLGHALNYPQSITHIAEDQNGRFWMGSGSGIISVMRSDLEAYIADTTKEIDVINFGLAEGMMASGCPGGIFPAGCTLNNGKIWFTTLFGITEVDPTHIRFSSYTPAVVIQDLRVNNESACISTTYNIPAGAIELEIIYSAPSFIMPEELNFRYKLEGYDHQWIEAQTRRSAFYNKLPPGDYTFHVQVMNHHGQWGEQTQLIKIHINPFFYQTTWFLASCILLVIASFYLIMKYRIRQVREKELEHLVLLRTEEIRKLNEELEQKVIDRTAQLGATNAELEAFSYSVSHDLKAPVRRIEGLIAALVEDYNDKLDTSAQDFLAKISESVATMGLLIDELLKLSRIARQEIERSDVNLSSMAERILEKLKAVSPERAVIVSVSPDLVVDCDARLIQIALQNLLDNAWKYTGHKETAEITVERGEKEGKPVIIIRDNGVGFDMNHYNKLFTPFQRLHSDEQFSGTGIGLATVRRIIQKHGGAIWAESEPGKGSSFFFTLA